MGLRIRSRARALGTTPVSESRRDRRRMAREAGLGRVSVVSLFGGVAAGVTACALLIGAAAVATGAVNFDTDLMRQEWRNLDAPDAAIMSVALFIGWLFGGYVAGRMARRAGVSNGFYTWVLGAVLLVGAVAALNDVTRGSAVGRSFAALGIPTDLDHWRELPALAGVSWAFAALVGACFGGGLGERWHTRLVARAADPTIGPSAVPPADTTERPAHRHRDRDMIDVSERLGSQAESDARPAQESGSDEREHAPSV
jgi:hypothetical protein